MARRVVVTGLGVISPVGCGVKSMWKNLLSCKSGIRTIDSFDTTGMSSKIAGLVPIGEPDGFDIDAYIPPNEQRKMDKFIAYAIAAAAQVAEDAGLDSLSEEQRARTAVMIGSGVGGLSGLFDTSVTLFSKGARRVSPFFIPSVLINLASGHIAMRYNLTGPNIGIVSACASGTHSIGEAFRSIRDGYNDFALAGGAEAAACNIGMAGFSSAQALSRNFNDTPEKASRPWDRQRDGFVVGEGAGVIFLETMESARLRGATIYGEIVGYGASCDAHHITTPKAGGLGAQQAMRAALRDANMDTDEVEYLNAHGTSTPLGDLAESQAIKAVFGTHAYDMNVSSTKSAMGHMLGAAGAVEAIISLLAMRDGTIPPTLNLEEPDDECDLNFTALQPQERRARCAMSNSFGFGGANGCLVLKSV